MVHCSTKILLAGYSIGDQELPGYPLRSKTDQVMAHISIQHGICSPCVSIRSFLILRMPRCKVRICNG
jgi:hypothetical protein